MKLNSVGNCFFWPFNRFFSPSPNLKPLQPTSFSFFLYFCFVLWNKSRRRCLMMLPKKNNAFFFLFFFQFCETNIIFLKKNLWKFILFYCHFLGVKTRRKRRIRREKKKMKMKWKEKKQQLLSLQFCYFFSSFFIHESFFIVLCVGVVKNHRCCGKLNELKLLFSHL